MWVDNNTPEAVIRGIRAQLISFADASSAGPIGSRYEGEPVNFGGEFPAAVSRFIRARGQHRKYLAMPEELTYSLRIYTLAVGRRDIEIDGSREGEDELIAAWSSWITAIAASNDFRADVLGWEPGELEISAQDRFGRLFSDQEGQNVLLRLSCDFIITL